MLLQKNTQTTNHNRHQSLLGLTAELSNEIISERLRGVGRYVTTQATSEADITANRRFATGMYMDLGKINSANVDPETGLLLHDHFHESGEVQYINTRRRNGELVAVGKLAWSPGIPMDELRTPFADIQHINPELHDRLRALPDGSVAELGSLAKMPGVSQVATLGTLREIYRYAEDNGVQYMVAGLEPKAWPRYHALFGSGVECISEDTPLHYPGIDGGQVGICMNVAEAYQQYLRDLHTGSLALKLQRLLVNELFANRVGSFHSHFDDRNLRKLG